MQQSAAAEAERKEDVVASMYPYKQSYLGHPAWVFPAPPVCSSYSSSYSSQRFPMLYSGAKFKGEQSGTNQKCPVEVVIHHVDLHNWTLCGYLTIKNVQSQQSAAACTAGSGGSVSGGAGGSETTTFFMGEIICEKHPFLTRKWDADESVDRKHWSKFLLHFKPFEKTFNDDSFDWERLHACGALFMRWKELFIVAPPSSSSSSSLATSTPAPAAVDQCSFGGFYYISLDKRFGDIEGYYFQKSSHDASYQTLMLEFKPDTETTQVFQLR